MPFVTMTGVPTEMSDQKLSQLINDTQKAVCCVDVLGLKGMEDEVSVLLVPTLVPGGYQRNILCETTGLRDEPERTLEVRKSVAEAVRDTADRHFPDSYVASRVGDPYDYTEAPFCDNAE